MSGVLTNGVMRDLGDLADDFPVIAGSVGPSHAFVHVREIGTPVNIFPADVHDGDPDPCRQAWRGIIPADVVADLEAAIHKMFETEKLILEPAQQSDFDFDAFQKAWAEFEKART